MSYSTENIFPPSVRLPDIREIIELLGYKRIGKHALKTPNELASYYWFERNDHRSWTGVELSIHRDEDRGLVLSTRTRSSRSYWDLHHQNRTVRLLRRLLGGYFETDAGKNRCWTAVGPPMPAVESGCYLALWNFDSNLLRARVYMDHRQFVGGRDDRATSIWWIDTMNPRIISNNLLVPYVVATMEDYIKSTYITLLRYSDRKETVLRSARLSSVQHHALAEGRTSLEEAIAEGLSFQRPSAILASFATLDPKLDLAATLRRPYRRRKLLDSLDALVHLRHELIHRSAVDGDLNDKRILRFIGDVTASIRRCYERICERNGWSTILPLGFEARSDT